MKSSAINTFQYLESADFAEAVAYAASQAQATQTKWYVFAQGGAFVCSDLAHVHPFEGVVCVAEIHGQNLPKSPAPERK